MTDPTHDHVIITLMEFPVLRQTYFALRKDGYSSPYDIASRTDNDVNDFTCAEVDDNGNITGTNVPFPNYIKADYVP
jgi:hypothetical protein